MNATKWLESQSVMALRTCKLCNMSVPKHGHVYSTTHKRKVAALLDRFQQRIAPALVTLAHPERGVPEEAAMAATGSDSPTFWCYFCEKELPAESAQEELEEPCAHEVFE